MVISKRPGTDLAGKIFRNAANKGDAGTQQQGQHPVSHERQTPNRDPCAQYYREENRQAADARHRVRMDFLHAMKIRIERRTMQSDMFYNQHRQKRGYDKAHDKKNIFIINNKSGSPQKNHRQGKIRETSYHGSESIVPKYQ
jgi:hypothetical protein